MSAAVNYYDESYWDDQDSKRQKRLHLIKQEKQMSSPHSSHKRGKSRRSKNHMPELGTTRRTA